MAYFPKMRKKIHKLIKSPKRFFLDFYANTQNKFYLSINRGQQKKIVFAFNIAHWKRNFIKKCFPNSYFVFISSNFNLKKYQNYICANENVEFLIWGANIPESAMHYISKCKIKTKYLEDGFVRSVGLGALHILPHSICLDERGIYFDARKSSDLEVMLQGMDFSSDEKLMQEAKECINLIIENDITKYNLPQTELFKKLYGPKDRRRILVIGQVEDDQSILFGCDRLINNNDVVHLAAKENPDAQIIYKIHPDVLAAKRKELSNPSDVSDLAVLIREPMSLRDALSGVDKVYTISSLAGFECLLRGIPVVTLGCPFYSGWGLTDSRQVNLRRTRTLSLEELFAGAYLVYPKYFDPETGERKSLKETIEYFCREMKKNSFFEY